MVNYWKTTFGQGAKVPSPGMFAREGKMGRNWLRATVFEPCGPASLHRVTSMLLLILFRG